jgi:hypothetical protein
MHGGRFGWEGGGRSRGVPSWESGARCLVRGGVEGVVADVDNSGGDEDDLVEEIRGFVGMFFWRGGAF